MAAEVIICTIQASGEYILPFRIHSSIFPLVSTYVEQYRHALCVSITMDRTEGYV